MWLERSAHHARTEISSPNMEKLTKRYRYTHVSSYFLILNGIFILIYGYFRFSEIYFLRVIWNIFIVIVDILFTYTQLYAWSALKLEPIEDLEMNIPISQIQKNPAFLQESTELGITVKHLEDQTALPLQYGFNQYFIESFSKILHEVTRKDLMICKGVIRLAIRETLQRNEILDYNEGKRVINEGIEQWLTKCFIPNVSEIINRMNQEIITKQSLFTFYV